MQNQSVIEITQDGIGRVFFEKTPREVNALYTEGLQTCVALLIYGKKGLSLIHNTGYIRNEIIEAEYKALGEIEFWTLVYNPIFYPEKKYSEKLQAKMGSFIEVCQKCAKDKYLRNENDQSILLHEAQEGFVSFSRSGNVNTTVQLDSDSIMPLTEKTKRNRINILNNYFSICKDSLVVGDLQYDGLQYTNSSSLTGDLTEWRKVAIEKGWQDGLRDLNTYARNYEPLIYSSWITEQINISHIIDELNGKYGYSKSDKLMELSQSFFQYSPDSQWKNYPENSLKGKYQGHDVRFFTFRNSTDPNAKPHANELTNKLINDGFSAELKNSNAGPSVLVDLTTSKIKF